MAYSLPALEYSTDSLEPHIDGRTMEIHHGKHHQTYVDKLNTALSEHNELSALGIENLISDISALPDSVKSAVRNNGGGHANHSFFWKCISPSGGGLPQGELLSSIEKTFGNFNSFKSEFTQAALTRFGSGWAWLVKQSDGNLAVTSTPNQDSPLMSDVADCFGTPIIGLDVWEHAYYLNYQNRRPDYVSGFWNIVDWERANSLFC